MMVKIMLYSQFFKRTSITRSLLQLYNCNPEQSLTNTAYHKLGSEQSNDSSVVRFGIMEPELKPDQEQSGIKKHTGGGQSGRTINNVPIFDHVLLQTGVISSTNLEPRNMFANVTMVPQQFDRPSLFWDVEVYSTVYCPRPLAGYRHASSYHTIEGPIKFILILRLHWCWLRCSRYLLSAC